MDHRSTNHRPTIVRRLIVGSACALGGVAACACDATRARTDPGPRAGAPPQMVVTPFAVARARFAPLDPKAPAGPQISVLWGDHRTGPSTALLRFPRSYGGRLHTHTADHHLSLLEGTMKHWGAGRREVDARALGPGAYWYQPGGEVHSDNCLSDYCIAFVKLEGPIDARFVE